MSAICDLVVLLGDRASIVTTNFDEAVEIELEQRGISYVQYTVDDARAWTNRLANPSVSDVPSACTCTASCLGLVRLATLSVSLPSRTSSRHGPSARSVVAESLVRSNVLFIGVSLTDPNLVGPLWDAKAKRVCVCDHGTNSYNSKRVPWGRLVRMH